MIVRLPCSSSVSFSSELLSLACLFGLPLKSKRVLSASAADLRVTPDEPRTGLPFMVGAGHCEGSKTPTGLVVSVAFLGTGLAFALGMRRISRSVHHVENDFQKSEAEVDD